MSHIEWNQTANISYRALRGEDRKNIDRILSALSPADLIEDSQKLNPDLYVYRVPPFLRLLFKLEGSSIRVMDILDKRVIESFLGKKIA